MALEESPDDRWAQEVKRVQGGDRQAFSVLVRGLQRTIYGLCLRMLRSEAEAKDAAQEAFCRMFEHLHRFDGKRPFEVWALTVARNHCLDLLRKSKRAPHDELEPLVPFLRSDAPAPEAHTEARQQLQLLELAMGRLAISDREVLSLYYVNKRTTQEISDILNVAPGTIMSRLFRAREKLRADLQSQEASP